MVLLKLQAYTELKKVFISVPFKGIRLHFKSTSFVYN